jgi:TolA-binding protein
MATSQTPILQGPVLEDSALDNELFWEKNKSRIFTGAAILLFTIVAAIGWFIKTNQANSHAQKLLAEATGIEGYQAVIAKYPSSMPAADARMRIASTLREVGKLDDSTAAFRAFLKDFPQHELAGGALLGIGQNQDSAGDTASAIATYQQVVTQYPQSYAAPYAAYSEAEIYLRSFQREEARRSYNMIGSQFPLSPVARMAASQLSRLAGTPGPQGTTGSIEASVAKPAVEAVPVPTKP